MRFVPIAALIAAAASILASSPAGAQESASVAGVCADCHSGVGDRQLGALQHADDVSCLSCHHLGFSNDPAVTEARREAACVACHSDGEVRVVAATHAGLADTAPSCTDCHSVHADPGAASARDAISARCEGCHDAAEHVMHAGVDVGAPVCADCHTSHVDGGAGPTPAPPDMTGACAVCHEASHPNHAPAMQSGDFACTACHTPLGPPRDGAASETVAQCLVCHADTHASHAAVADGNAPTCLDCHDFRLDAPTDASATSARCASCHVDAAIGFSGGGHAAGLAADPNPDLPTCLTCHTSHVEPGADRSQLRLAATVRCIECHSRELLVDEYGLPAVTESYEDDFHGATARFMWNHPEAGEDLPPIMVCSDCHGAHEVGWGEERVLADVCRGCHEESDDYLAGAWLGHGDIGPRNQPLIFLVRLFYYLLIPFMLGGLFLTIVFHLKTERRHGARVMSTPGVKRLVARLQRKPVPREETVTRFSVTDRWEHVGSALTFILLVVTGLPQTRPDLPVANSIIALLGGIGTTRLIHRIIGFTFVALMIAHVSRGIFRAIRGHRLPVMVPHRKDFEDIVQSFRHYLFGAERPRFGKFDFGEKFEYWGLFLGGVVMSTTGIILVFPELVTQFLPGVVVAATRVMHGLEATFAVMVVILWHTWGVALRPEVFPLDTSIFTGRMRVSQLKREHPEEYRRLFPEESVTDSAQATDGGPPPVTRAEDGLAKA